MLALTGLDLSVNERHLAAIEQAGSRRIRGFGERRRVEVWRGLRPCSPDGLPLVGPTAAVDRLVVATGHATLGFTLAPLTGRLVAQVVAGERPEHDLTPLSPDRFHGLSSLLGRPGRQHGAG